MKWLFRISAGLLVVDLALLTVWICVRVFSSPASFNPLELSPWIVTAGVLAALITLSINQLRVASEEYLENATDLFEKSYEILAETKDDHGRPKNSRINWLTSARLIRTAENIAALVTVDSHRRIWREQKEYWRGRLRDLINPSTDGFPKDYYASKPEHMFVYGDTDQEPLSETSLSVLYRFVMWPKDIEDPLRDDTSFSKDEIKQMVLFGPRGLGKLLEEVEQIRARKQGQNA